MTRFDEDKDGKLNADEQKGYDEYVKLLGIEARQKFDMLMERFDANKDGALDADELAQLKAGIEGKMEGKGDAKGKGKKKKVGDKPEDAPKDDMQKPAEGDEMEKDGAKWNNASVSGDRGNPLGQVFGATKTRRHEEEGDRREADTHS